MHVYADNVEIIFINGNESEKVFTMHSEELFSKLQKLAPDTAVEMGWLIAEWDPQGVIEQEILSLKGPVLDSTIQELREALETDTPQEGLIHSLLDRVKTILDDSDLVLSGGAAVGCGCLHTSRYS